MAWNKETRQTPEEIAKIEQELFGTTPPVFNYSYSEPEPVEEINVDKKQIDLESDEGERVINDLLADKNLFLATCNTHYDNGEFKYDIKVRIVKDEEKLYLYEYDEYSDNEEVHRISKEQAIKEIENNKKLELTELGIELGFGKTTEKITNFDLKENLEEALKTVTSKEDYSKSVIICDVNNPDKYMEVSSKEATSERGLYIITEFKVNNQGEEISCDEFKHGKFMRYHTKDGENTSNTGKEHWKNIVKEMQSKGEFNDKIVIFENVKDFEKYKENPDVNRLSKETVEVNLQGNNDKILQAFGTEIYVKNEIDFSGNPAERFSPRSTKSYVIQPDKDLLLQMFERVPQSEIEVIVEGMTDIKEILERKSEEAELQLYLNSQNEIEQIRLELADCGFSIEYPLTGQEQKSCMKAIERCEERINQKNKETKGHER